jgi:hypothetical protein
MSLWMKLSSKPCASSTSFVLWSDVFLKNTTRSTSHLVAWVATLAFKLSFKDPVVRKRHMFQVDSRRQLFTPINILLSDPGTLRPHS